MTEEEKIEMYMKSSKKELVSMLMANQRLISSLLAGKPALTFMGNPKIHTYSVTSDNTQLVTLT